MGDAAAGPVVVWRSRVHLASHSLQTTDWTHAVLTLVDAYSCQAKCAGEKKHDVLTTRLVNRASRLRTGTRRTSPASEPRGDARQSTAAKVRGAPLHRKRVE